MATEDTQESAGQVSQPVRRWRHRHKILSALAILAVPVLLVLTSINWRYRFQFQEGQAIELPSSKKALKGWEFNNPSRVTISKENKNVVLELRSTGEGPATSAIYRLPHMEDVDFVRVQAEMRCLGQHDAAAWQRARINLLGYTDQNKALYKYPHELGFIKDNDLWQIEDSVFKLSDEARYFEIQVLNQKTTLLQVKNLKVQVARERTGILSYGRASFLLGICWIIAVSLVARAFGGARKWWRSISVAAVLVVSFLVVVYPAIKRPIRPPLSRRFHDWESFEWKGSLRAGPEIKKQVHESPVIVREKRGGPRFAWLKENMSGAHVLLYGAITLAICVLAWSARAAWMAGAVALLQEARQTWIDHNTDVGDLADLGMDLLGILLGVLVYLVIRYHLLKRLTRWAKQMWKEQV